MKRLVHVLVLVGVVAGFLVGAASAQPPIPPGLARAINAQEAHTDALLARPGVVGTAVGLSDRGVPVVRIFVAEAGLTGLPDVLDGVPVEVVVTGRFWALPALPPAPSRDSGGDPQIDPTDRFDRPVPIGVSTGHPDITAGTIGARLTDGPNVYADVNNASIGDNVLQPGTVDGGQNPADAIGTLADFEPIDFDGGDNVMDAAIALSSLAMLSNGTPADGHGIPSSTTAPPVLGTHVQKYG